MNFVGFFLSTYICDYMFWMNFLYREVKCPSLSHSVQLVFRSLYFGEKKYFSPVTLIIRLIYTSVQLKGLQSPFHLWRSVILTIYVGCLGTIAWRSCSWASCWDTDTKLLCLILIRKLILMCLFYLCESEI